MFTIYKPLKNTFITQGFGLLNTAPSLIPMYQTLGLNGHNGIDFSAPTGTPIYYNVSQRGTVWQTGVYDDGCKYIKIITRDGNNIYQHRYLHLQSFKVNAGDTLEGGEIIGWADNTGKYTTGSHLHYDLSPMIQSSNSYSYMEPSNGYGGQIDPSPFYDPTFIVDVMREKLNTAIKLIMKILDFLKGR